jgi:hypothetical protein
VAAGRTVQLVGRIGDGRIADDVVFDLAHEGVGHVALLRDMAQATAFEPQREHDEPSDDETDDFVAEPTIPRSTMDAADVELGMRYLTEYSVVVLAEEAVPDVVAIVAEAARWSEARLILLIGDGDPVPDGIPSDAVVLEAPDTDPDGAFATVVGAFAAGLDAGTDPAHAFGASLDVDGWTAAPAE